MFLPLQSLILHSKFYFLPFFSHANQHTLIPSSIKDTCHQKPILTTKTFLFSDFYLLNLQLSVVEWSSLSVQSAPKVNKVEEKRLLCEDFCLCRQCELKVHCTKSQLRAYTQTQVWLNLCARTVSIHLVDARKGETRNSGAKRKVPAAAKI